MQPASPPPGSPPPGSPPAPPGPGPSPSAPPGGPPPAQAAAPEPPPARWYDIIDLYGFVDGYVSVNYNFPAVQTGKNTLRAFDVTNGAAIHWAGLDAAVAPDPIGGTVSLRFGPSAKIYSGADANIGLEFVKQAFASLRPGGKDGKVTIDFGKFDQPFGSEVADSQLNINYTRSVLYQYTQPLFFTGLRFDYAPVPQFDIKLFAVNGWNTSADNNAGKSFGLQLIWKPSEVFNVYLGYMTGPEQADTSYVYCAPGTVFDKATSGCKPEDGAPGGSTAVTDGKANERFRHLADVVIDINPTKSFRILANGDILADRVVGADGKDVNVKAFGANLAMRLAFNDLFSAAVRAGVLSDPDGFATGFGEDTTVFDGTLTLGLSPSANFTFLLDGRLDLTDKEVFERSNDTFSKTQFTTTLGLIAKSR